MSTIKAFFSGVLLYFTVSITLEIIGTDSIWMEIAILVFIITIVSALYIFYFKPKQKTKTKPVEVISYDVEWKYEFIRIKNMIYSMIGDLIIDIQHVGSTSVDGLAAKAIIDIDVIIEDYNVFDEIVMRLEKQRFKYMGNQGIEGREAFKRLFKDEFMDYHLYVCTKDSDELKRHIIFRDYLRDNLMARKEYSELKKYLAVSYKHDRVGYTDNKSEFIESVLAKASDKASDIDIK